TLQEDVDEGPDVRQLEQALVDLGYDPDGALTVDEDFTGFTATVVERWQEDVGIEEDGIV
ncbi:MAG: peptidoglycan-binding protein, partial [Actinobacteria bacterium]|nr:peptidoglycan-binding protein [Actinomycetota bacterium]NIS28505.1 peptidoglycan-binding protein [Actinomycetota bacterium]NIT94187.1 peptidoglycan-binding protein [Actinomycetota bacterium]NIU17620.1 peptidoglycan-binding protein [Actinomycetota bacterium]NIU63976.1 peptidoglycan-binding protein [Actinomycetota bacterium]